MISLSFVLCKLKSHSHLQSFVGQLHCPLNHFSYASLYFNFTVSLLRCRDPSHTPFSRCRQSTSYVVAVFFSVLFSLPFLMMPNTHWCFLFVCSCTLSQKFPRVVNDDSKISFLSCNCLFQASHHVGMGRLFFPRFISLLTLTLKLTCHLSACSALFSSFGNSLLST